MVKWHGKPPDEVAIFAVETSKLDCTPKALKHGGYHIPTTHISPECLQLRLLIEPSEEEYAKGPPGGARHGPATGDKMGRQPAETVHPAEHSKPPRPKREWPPVSRGPKKDPATRPAKMRQHGEKATAGKPPKKKGN